MSVLEDETTDISTKKCLAVLACFVDVNGCQVVDTLLALIEVENSNADDLTKAITEVLNQYKIGNENIIGFAADNASVMMGDFNSANTRPIEKHNFF